MIGHFGDFFVTFASDGNHHAAACFNLLDVRQGLLVVDLTLFRERIPRGKHDDRKILVDERVRPMLHFAGGIALGVNIRDFLELQRAFQSNGEMDAPPEIKKVLRFRQVLRHLLINLGIREHLLQFSGDLSQFLDESAGRLRIERAPDLPHIHAEDE